ncbi:MAG: stage V sporulation protein SpoVM [Oscillospiraceae bacterium]
MFGVKNKFDNSEIFSNKERGKGMKIVVIKPPKFISGILKMVFKIKKVELDT